MHQLLSPCVRSSRTGASSGGLGVQIKLGRQNKNLGTHKALMAGNKIVSNAVFHIILVVDDLLYVVLAACMRLWYEAPHHGLRGKAATDCREC